MDLNLVDSCSVGRIGGDWLICLLFTEGEPTKVGLTGSMVVPVPLTHEGVVGGKAASTSILGFYKKRVMLIKKYYFLPEMSRTICTFCILQFIIARFPHKFNATI